MILEKTKNLRIVPFSRNHVSEAVTIEQKSFPTPWSHEAFVNELKLPTSIGLVAILDDERGERVVGYILGRRAADEVEIINLAVHPLMRKKGVAKALLRRFVDEIIRGGSERIFLEVRETNEPAIRLYKGFGFERVGVRRGYYVDTGEDALIMKLEIE